MTIYIASFNSFGTETPIEPGIAEISIMPACIESTVSRGGSSIGLLLGLLLELLLVRLIPVIMNGDVDIRDVSETSWFREFNEDSTHLVACSIYKHPARFSRTRLAQVSRVGSKYRHKTSLRYSVHCPRKTVKWSSVGSQAVYVFLFRGDMESAG